MTAPAWQDALDDGLVRRLRRPVDRPGVTDPGQARRILERARGMTAGLPLLDTLGPRTDGLPDGSPPPLPIVFAETHTAEPIIQRKLDPTAAPPAAPLPTVFPQVLAPPPPASVPPLVAVLAADLPLVAAAKTMQRGSGGESSRGLAFSTLEEMASGPRTPFPQPRQAERSFLGERGPAPLRRVVSPTEPTADVTATAVPDPQERLAEPAPGLPLVSPVAPAEAPVVVAAADDPAAPERALPLVSPVVPAEAPPVVISLSPDDSVTRPPAPHLPLVVPTTREVPTSGTAIRSLTGNGWSATNSGQRRGSALPVVRERVVMQRGRADRQLPLAAARPSPVASPQAPAGVPAMRSGAPVLPPTVPSGTSGRAERAERPDRGTTAPVDVDRIAATVHRRFLRQLAVESERRGVR